MAEAFTILRHDDRELDPITREQLEALADRRPDLGRVAVPDGARGYLVFESALRSPRRASTVALLLNRGRLFYDGRADEEILKRLLQIADELGARVRDNRIKTYRDVKDRYLHPEDVEAARRHEQRVASARRGSFWDRYPATRHLLGWWHIILAVLAVFGWWLAVK